MNLYRIDCTIWIRAETDEDAAQHFADEVSYLISLENTLVAVERNDPELVEEK